jgi:hypothetical protein
MEKWMKNAFHPIFNLMAQLTIKLKNENMAWGGPLPSGQRGTHVKKGYFFENLF